MVCPVRRFNMQEEHLNSRDMYPLNYKGTEVYFTDLRVSYLPEDCNLHKYEVRYYHNEESGWEEPCEISTSIWVDFYGTILSQKELSLPEKSNATGLYYDYIDDPIKDFDVRYDEEPISALELINTVGVK